MAAAESRINIGGELPWVAGWILDGRMSDEGVEVVKQAFNALRRGNPDDALVCFTDDVEWHNTAAFPGPRKVVGPEALVAFSKEVQEPWSADGERIAEIRTGENRVVLCVHSWGRGRGSGIPVDQRWAMSFTLRAGKIARVDVRGSFAKALEAAGLSEQAMSEENVKIVRGFIEAFNNGDYMACLERLDAGIEWHPPPDIPNAAVAYGREGLIANFQDWLGAWEDYEAITEEIREGEGTTVVVTTLESGRGRDSGIEVSRRITQVYELQGSKIVRFKAYLDRSEALAAAGLSE